MATTMPASILDDYDLIQQLPTPGGMGLVYRVRRRSGEPIALKVVPLQQDGEADAIVRSERRGAAVQKLLGELDPHVPRVYDFGEKDGVFFIEMEFIDGEDLSAILKRSGRIPAREAARIACEVAAFLEVAHHTGVGGDSRTPAELVHSDLKPSNIRIADQTGEVKILDFGIARAGWQTVTAQQFGSVPYMSPERIEGEIDRHADYWALGVVLYEMLAGQLPFRVPDGPSRSHRLEQLIVSRRPAPPLTPDVPPGLCAIVARLLHPDREKRYQDATDLKADLDAFVHGRMPQAVRGYLQPHEGDTIVVKPLRQVDAIAALRLWIERWLVRPSRQRVGLAAVRVGAVAVAAIAIDACVVRRASNDLVEVIQASSLDPDVAWARYEQLRRWAVVPILLGNVQPPLKHTLVAAADYVAADFRRDQPTVRASHWEAARGWLEKAASIGDFDPAIAAKLQVAEAHLLRIDAEGIRNDVDRTATLRQAIQRFEQAARLDGSAPDPYLGLARIYTYGLIDADRASEALAEAERRGHPIGRRGHAQLGDVMKSRADRLRQSAARVRALPEERLHLRAAAADYERALGFYGKAPGFGDVADNVRATRARLGEVRRRLGRLESGPDT
jgi:tetratricopeptide (TPR) repeat protein